MTNEQNLPELSSGTLGGAIAAAKSSAAKNDAEGTDGTKNRSRSRGSRGGRGRGPKKDAAQNGSQQDAKAVSANQTEQPTKASNGNRRRSTTRTKHVSLDHKRPQLTPGSELEPESFNKPRTRKPRSGNNSRRAVKNNPDVTLKVIPLGGLDGIGKNMTVIECGDDMILDDAGLMFPDDDHPGIDLILPDYTYVLENEHKLRGIIITHGHEDHTGSLPYLMKDLTKKVPIYGTKMTLGLIEGKFKEHRIKAKLCEVNPGDEMKIGNFVVDFFAVNHSIPGALGVFFQSPAGNVLHTGDFKIDLTPVSGEMIDLVRIGELGKKGLLALMSDSTNVERPGYTPSEKIVGKSLEKFIMESDQRIIIATFASNVSRLQQILDIAAKAGRKVAVCGRSMEKISKVSMELGYLKDSGKVMIDISEIKRYARSQLIIVSTGSQGETMSALYRMAYGSHKQVEVNSGDRILIAASAIPGNEKSINNMVNELYKQGAEVIYDRSAAIHVSGHACQEDLKLMLGLCKPKYFIPVHGEYRMLVQHARLAQEMGVNPKNVLITEIGRPVEIGENSARLGNSVPAGRLLVDGLGIGDVGTAVLRDRKHLSEDGLLVIVVTVDATTGVVIAGPDIVSRGFVYVKEAEALMEELRTISQMALDRCSVENLRDWNSLKSAIKGDVSDYLFKKTKRSPMVLPIIMEI